MANSQSDIFYSIDDIREAFEANRDGSVTDHKHPLNVLATELAKSDHIYQICPQDLVAYLDDQMLKAGMLSEKQQETFHRSARKYIENAETFGESLKVCLELAMDDANRS